MTLSQALISLSFPPSINKAGFWIMKTASAKKCTFQARFWAQVMACLAYFSKPALRARPCIPGRQCNNYSFG